MIVLHAGEYNNTLFLWGETSKDDIDYYTTLSKTKSASSKYPFATTTKELTMVMKSIDIKSTKSQFHTIKAWLPTKGAAPIPSSIIAEPPSSKAATKISPWVITARQLSPKETVDLLCASMNKQTIASGILIGADLRFWANTLRFIGSMVARQRFLPDIITNENKHNAVWNPVFVNKDAERLLSLAKHMPTVGRALSDTSTTTPPVRSPVAILQQFTTTLTDHLVRTSTHKAGTTPPNVLRKRFDSIHDSWIHSLRSTRSAVAGDPYDISQLTTQILDWQRPIAISAESHFRLCFRLEEPKDDDDKSWYIHYLLQPHDDPSLLVSADDIWRSDDAVIPRKSIVNAKEFLLISLGQASTIYPDITTNQTGESLAGHAVNTDKAHNFLTNQAVALEQAGYGIILPAWWTGKGTKTKLAARAKIKKSTMQGNSGLTLNTIIQFDWEVALGEQKITLQELEKLAQLKTSLVKIRGQWTEVNSTQIQQAINFLRKGTKKSTLRDVIQMEMGTATTTGTTKDMPGLDFEGIKATGKISDMFKHLNEKAGFKELEPPKGFQGTLRPYQLRGYSWLSFLQQWSLGGCLADDMGLGKTIQILALIQHNQNANDKKPVLIVCPTSVINNWQKEASRFTPKLSVMIHHGSNRRQDVSFKKDAKKHTIVITSYGLIQRDKSFADMTWGGIVLDEAQNVKNPTTKQAKAAQSLKANYHFALTGTPVENNVGDLWSIMEFLNPGFLGTQKDFKDNFFVPIQVDQDQDATDRLRRTTNPFILRRLKTDKSIISDLPEKMEMDVFCSLTKEQASLYSAVIKDIEEELFSAEGIKRKGLILSAFTKFKQICNHPAQFLGDNSSIANRSGKLARLTEMLEEVIEVGERALVFTQFVQTGHIIKRHIQETFGQEVLFLHGGVSRSQRDKMVEKFQADSKGESQIFVLSLKAGGTGLNLTAANHVFHFDRWWNPAVENQATDRVFRIGQKRNVQVHKFICVGTLEEKIDEMINRKKYIAEKVVGTGEGWLTEMSNDDLRGILTLSKEAVME